MSALARPPLLIAPLGACLGTATVMAGDGRVTTEADAFDGVCDSHCSLRDAVDTANGLSGPQRIVLPAGVYRLDLPAPRAQPWMPPSVPAAATISAVRPAPRTAMATAWRCATWGPMS